MSFWLQLTGKRPSAIERALLAVEAPWFQATQRGEPSARTHGNPVLANELFDRARAILLSQPPAYPEALSVGEIGSALASGGHAPVEVAGYVLGLRRLLAGSYAAIVDGDGRPADDVRRLAAATSQLDGMVADLLRGFGHRRPQSRHR